MYSLGTMLTGHKIYDIVCHSHWSQLVTGGTLLCSARAVMLQNDAAAVCFTPALHCGCSITSLMTAYIADIFSSSSPMVFTR